MTYLNFGKKLSAMALLAASTVVTATAGSFDFTATCLNVDGLPSLINSDGPGSAGSKKISERIAQSGWDFVAFSEDFEYHDELMSVLSSVYDAGTYRGTVNLGTIVSKADTDGLNLIWKKDYNAFGERFEEWIDKHGGITQGANENIRKGYRYYCVQLTNDYTVDVYVHHMNSESSAEAIAAKHSQINQLVKDILSSDNKRPIIILGDTNCRYTRENLHDLLFGAINADPRFEIRDPWVDFARGGVEPALGAPSLMVDDLGHQQGEVVDKIFYINNRHASARLEAKSYLRDSTFVDESGKALADHFPIVVDFTIDEQEPDLDLSRVYFMRNVGTGKFLRAGATWGTHAIVGETGNRISFIKGTEANLYLLKSTAGFFDRPDVYIDKGSDVSHQWKVLPTAIDNAYIIGYDDMALGVADTATGVVNCLSADASDPLQQWELVTEEQLIAELSDAMPSRPKDATFLIHGADFGVNDSENDLWQWSGNSKAKREIGGTNEWDDKDWVFRSYNDSWRSTIFNPGSLSQWTLSQTIENLPDGKYIFSCQALLCNIDPGNITFTLNGGNNITVKKSGDAILTAAEAVAYFRTGDYDISQELEITGGKLEIKISKGNNSSATAACFDNFRLIYLGSTAPQEIEVTFNGEYDTLILPFDHVVPEGLSVFETHEYSIMNDSYYVVKLEAVAEIKANTPYVVCSENSQARVAVNSYTFTGIPDYEQDEYTYGLLTGTHVDRMGHTGEHVLFHNSNGSYFYKLDDTMNRIVDAHHAFINEPAGATVITFYPEGIATGVENVAAEENDGMVDVYSVSGVPVKKGVDASSALDDLSPGIYIVRNGSKAVKMAK